MTAFLFISPTTGAELGRRVDFANIGSLFAETDDAPTRNERAHKTRIGLLILVLFGLIGDTLLVAHPEALAHSLLGAKTGHTVHKAVTL